VAGPGGSAASKGKDEEGDARKLVGHAERREALDAFSAGEHTREDELARLLGVVVAPDAVHGLDLAVAQAGRRVGAWRVARERLQVRVTRGWVGYDAVLEAVEAVALLEDERRDQGEVGRLRWSGDSIGLTILLMCQI